MQILQIDSKSDIALLEQAIRAAYKCDASVPCAALNSASYFMFRQTCESDLQKFQHSDLSVTLPWPSVRLTMTGGFVSVVPQRTGYTTALLDSHLYDTEIIEPPPNPKRTRLLPHEGGNCVLKTATENYNASVTGATNHRRGDRNMRKLEGSNWVG